ncbi:MAG: hypothetical protein L0Z50_23645, partial [Verrucomicrobiales bacterium]|nr:hypothetical protein [Verrucomicrobiales bacterium]
MKEEGSFRLKPGARIAKNGFMLLNSVIPGRGPLWLLFAAVFVTCDLPRAVELPKEGAKPARLTATNVASTRPIPKRDPADQPFRRAPMRQSARSIAIPLGTNLHLAFDTELLRTHSAWAGPSLNLYGPPYHGG